MSASQGFLSTSFPAVSLETHLSQKGIDPAHAHLYTQVRPIIPKVAHNKHCLPAANYYHALSDASLFLRNIPDAMSMIFARSVALGGDSVVGLPAINYTIIGGGEAYNSYKQMKACQKIGDTEGEATAGAQIVENLSISIAAAALAVVRGFGIVQEAFQVLKEPIILSSAAMIVKAASAWVSTAFFTAYYAIFVWRQVGVLRGLAKGNALRQKLLSSENSLDALKSEIAFRMTAQSKSEEEVNLSSGGEPLKDLSHEELTEIALEEGARWLEKLEKEIPVKSWKPTLESRKEHVRQLFLSDPRWMMAEMGYREDFIEDDAQDKLVAFGEFIAAKRLYAKIENDLVRLLGSEAVTAAKKDDLVAFEKALKSADWSQWGARWKTVLKISLAVIGISAIVAGTIFSGGLALGIPLLALGAVGIIWIVFSDGALLKSQWESGEVGMRDQFLIYFSVAASIAALALLITFTVLSGGIPLYVAALIFTTAWLVINGRAMIGMINSQRYPWDYQKEPTVKAFRRLVETKPPDKKIADILAKMSKFNQEGLETEMKRSNNWQKAAKTWEQYLQDLKRQSLDKLMLLH